MQTKELVQEMEDCRLQVSHTLQSCLQSDGRRRYATPPQQIAAFNRRSNPEVISSSGGEWIKAEGDVIVGDEVRILMCCAGIKHNLRCVTFFVHGLACPVQHFVLKQRSRL